MRKDDLVTLQDLENLKSELLNQLTEIKNTIKGICPPKNNWLKTADVKKTYDFSLGKLAVMRKKGLVAFSRIGGNLYYNLEDIEKMFNENKKGRK